MLDALPLLQEDCQTEKGKAKMNRREQVA